MFRKTLMGTVFAVSVMAAAAFPAKAAETIDEITMEINSDFYIGGGADTDYVSVLVDNTECRVESISVTNKPKDDEWEEGDRPKIKVIVRAESGYTFASGMGKGDVELGSEDAVITSVTRSGPRLTVSITLPKLDENDYNADMDYNLNASGLSWDQGNGMACWEEAAFAKKYEVRLFRGSSNVTGILTTTECSLDLSPYFTKSGNYIFKVRGVRSTTKKGNGRNRMDFMSMQKRRQRSRQQALKMPARLRLLQLTRRDAGSSSRKSAGGGVIRTEAIQGLYGRLSTAGGSISMTGAIV